MTDLRLYPEPPFNPRHVAGVTQDECAYQAIDYLTDMYIAQVALDDLMEAKGALDQFAQTPEVLDVIRNASAEELANMPEVSVPFPGMDGLAVIHHIEWSMSAVGGQVNRVQARVLSLCLAAFFCWVASL